MPLTKLASRSSSDSGIPTLIDSRVAIGAGARGRSSSTALNRIQRGSLGYVLGGGLYIALLGGVHRADYPTRHRTIRSPRIDKPAWLTDLEPDRSYLLIKDIETAGVECDIWPHPHWCSEVCGTAVRACDARRLHWRQRRRQGGPGRLTSRPTQQRRRTSMTSSNPPKSRGTASSGSDSDRFGSSFQEGDDQNSTPGKKSKGRHTTKGSYIAKVLRLVSLFQFCIFWVRESGWYGNCSCFYHHCYCHCYFHRCRL